MKPHEGIGSAATSSAGSDSDQGSTPPGEPEITLPDLDEEVIGKWRSFLPTDKFDDLVASQLKGAKDQAQRLLETAQAGKLDEIGRVAHDVKGVCGNLGMAKVYHLADGLTQACQSEQERDALNLLEAIRQAMPAATAAFEDRFVDHPGASST